MSETYPDPSTVGGAGFGAKLAFLVPAIVIVGAVVYLLARNPGARDAVTRLQQPTVTATSSVRPSPAPAIGQPPATPSATTPPARPNARDPLYAVDQAFVATPPYKHWRPGPVSWEGKGLGWGVNAVDWQPGDEPRVDYLGRDGNVYGFHVDGFAEGETVARDGVRVGFDIGGLPVEPGRVSVAGRPTTPTGMDVFVEVDGDLIGMIAPLLQFKIKTISGTSASLKVPFYHVGRRPERSFRLYDALSQVANSAPSGLVVPKSLPENSILQWAGGVAKSNMRALFWAVPVGDEWVSLSAYQGEECPAADDPVLHCFGDAAPVTNALEVITVAGRPWTLQERDGVWHAFARVDGIYVAFASPLRDVVIQAADAEVR